MICFKLTILTTLRKKDLMGEARNRNDNDDVISVVKERNNENLKLTSSLQMESRQF